MHLLYAGGGTPLASALFARVKMCQGAQNRFVCTVWLREGEPVISCTMSVRQVGVWGAEGCCMAATSPTAP